MLHYRRADGDYAGWGLHVWDGAANPTDWASAAAAGRHRRLRRRLPGAAGRRRHRLNYIVHKGDEKDLPDDQSLDFADAATRCGCSPAQPSGYLLPQAAGAARRTST